jgi:DNA repair ATPase RecN
MLNAPEVPPQPQPNEESEIEKLADDLDQRCTQLQEAIAHIEQLLVPILRRVELDQAESRIAHLEHEQRRIEGKLDELWREHTRLVNSLQ